LYAIVALARSLDIDVVAEGGNAEQRVASRPWLWLSQGICLALHKTSSKCSAAKLVTAAKQVGFAGMTGFPARRRSIITAAAP
jgi:hypothetical protein